jgi:hypothetical protein
MKTILCLLSVVAMGTSAFAGGFFGHVVPDGGSSALLLLGAVAGIGVAVKALKGTKK